MKSMKRQKRESYNALTASVRTEMAQPRMSKSARIAELSADKARVKRHRRGSKLFAFTLASNSK